MKKLFLTISIIALFAMGFAASGETTEKEKEFQGTYLLTDEDGVKWTFTFTCGDEPFHQVTAIKEGMSEDDMYYGKWYEYDKDIHSILMTFEDFHAGDPALKFPDGKTNFPGEQLFISDEEWLYKGRDYLKSKNTEKRIKIVKQ